MKIVAKITDLQLFLTEKRAEGKKIGFVPTMGALHLGHISLISESIKVTDITVCSIFVNPTQFNDKKDLERYPRMPKRDAELLQSSGCDVLFLPEVSEIYPNEDTRKFNFGYLDTILEGASRPGHYNGVAQVVSRLFDIVKPDVAFFGIKDYQQVMVVKALVKQLHLPIEIVASPILRDEDGLAMSSRNLLLSKEEREAATFLYQLLQKCKLLKFDGRLISEIKQFVNDELSKNALYRLDYIAICEADTLIEANEFRQNVTYVALIACYVGKIRLIDNLMLGNS
ncbi:MAG: pantoate--beta-alanine ligase [Bacteroidota bacterium]|nr:pantoate--beta-alanine ligase [Bacteroidota bacterium]